MKTIMQVIGVGILAATATLAAPSASPKPNVLLVAVDDLNPWVGYLGRNPQTITPDMDRLAKRGVWFTRSYCAAPVCNPSRAALMSGLRPVFAFIQPRLTEAQLPKNVHFTAAGSKMLARQVADAIQDELAGKIHR
jgi:hypothetical protein